MSVFDEVTIRPPWPDEMARLEHYLPSAFLFDRDPFLLVAVAGRVERIVGALSMTLRPLQKVRATWLSVRMDDADGSGAEMSQCALEEAWARDARSVYFGQTVEEESEIARKLIAIGFEPATIHEVYEADAKKMFSRLERVRQRLVAHNLIPCDAEITTLQPGVIPKVRQFLRQNLPESASVMALETAGYKPEHSIALMQQDEIKGVLLCRRMGSVSLVGLRAVAEELRGGLGWANLLLLHASLASGVRTGLEITRFEFDPALHHDTKQFAEVNSARMVGRRFLLKITRPAENVDRAADALLNKNYGVTRYP